MAEVEDINEIDLLNNIRNRYIRKQIFTNVGTTLIVINPFEHIEGIFGNSIIEDFLKISLGTTSQTKERKPHIYSTVFQAISSLLVNKTNQSIVISGESGAGKTETAKQCMNSITYYFGKEDIINTSNSKPSLEKQILSCNPILEAFGNAKTVRNDNSSRFGKYTTIHVDVETGKIDGAQISIYLLEKNRVCEPADGERSYHIFYHLINCGDNELLKRLNLTDDPSQYKYLSISNCYSSKNINDKKLFDETLEALKITGFTDNEILNIA
jgi:myosin heavy subunit